jgi:hypothetical protein
VKRNPPDSRPKVRADASGIVSNAGVDLLYRTAGTTGLDQQLRKALQPWCKPLAIHHPGKIILDLVVMLAAGGDCPADIAMLRSGQQVFGPVASDPTVSRLIRELAQIADEQQDDGGPVNGLDLEFDSFAGVAVQQMRTARAGARAHANTIAAATGDNDHEADVTEDRETVVDIDASLITAHSEKDHAAGTYKRGFGFHPLLAYLDHGSEGTGEGLAGVLRPGNAGSNTANDHVGLLDLIAQQLDPGERAGQVVIRTDSAGASHGFLDELTKGGYGYSLGFGVTKGTPAAIAALSADDWVPAINGDGEPREGAWVAEITEHLNLSTWPEGLRVIARKERPHPGAQLRLTDQDGHRITCFTTDHPSDDLAALEVRHRARARCEDRIRNAKDTGLHNLPYKDAAANQIWIEIVLTAQTLLAHLQTLALEGKHAVAEPKKLRLHLFNIAARYIRQGRRRILNLDKSWPWVDIIMAAITRLDTIRVPG